MRFDALVEVSERVASTRSRTEKSEAIAQLLKAAGADEIPIAVSFLIGEPRQGRIGVGWAAVSTMESGARSELEPLDVVDIDRAIDTLAETSGSGSKEARAKILDGIASRSSEPELRFVQRLFTGELRQGALAGVMTDAIAKAAGVPVAVVRRAAMLSGDLPATAQRAIGGGRDALEAVQLSVGVAIEPMLAASSPDVSDALASVGRASVEWKLDGIRVQVHRSSAGIRVYTRNLNDVTDRVPSVVDAVRRYDATSFVLDGEALTLDHRLRPVAFQDSISTFGSQQEAVDQDQQHDHRLRPFFFDVLHVDGRDLLDASLEVRHAALDALVPESERVPRRTVDDAVAAQSVLESALAAGHEGVVVKGIESPYDAGRRGGTWRKVKPVITLDLVVIAAEWGHGRRTGWLSNLHLGARNPRSSQASGEFVMVGKTFKGLTDALLTYQTQALQLLELSTDGHVVHVRPELVVEIAIDGVQRSTRYPGGLALRFARVRGYRNDKRPEDADTIDTIRAIMQEV